MDCKVADGGFVTVNVVLAETVPTVAVIWVCPRPTEVTSPVALILAAVGFEDVHVAWRVTSAVEPSA